MFNQLSEKLRGTLKTLSGKGRLTESNISDALREVRISLLEADVALPVVKPFIEQVKQRAVGKEVTGSLSPGQALIKVVQEELVSLMGGSNVSLNLNMPPPATILMAGLQGAGKTTTVGKLANFLKQQEKKKVLTVSADIYRPAAIDQLKALSDSLALDFFPSKTNQKPDDIVVAAVAYAQKNGIDVVIIDTAGRLHVDEEMMQELKCLHELANPVETLFVVDSMTGQDAVNSAKVFDQTLPLTGIILTKIDGDARGGVALSIRHVTEKPIKFLGVGESMEALQPFHPDRIASRILGMGDVLSLVEEVENKVNKAKSEKLAKKLKQGKNFDLEDFRDQMLEIQNMGGMMKLMEKLPNMENLPQKALDQLNNKKTKQVIAIINSMTPHEKCFPAVIKRSRKQRIAAGAGTQVQNVNQLLKQFIQMQKTMKQMKKKGGIKGIIEQLHGNPPSGMPS